MSRYRWLLDLTTGGRVYRYSDDEVAVDLADGTVLDYAAGLGDDLELAASDPEVDVSLLDPSVPWPTVGPLLDGAVVVLRRWLEGTVRESADVYVRGTATDPEWGAAYESVEFTVRSVESLPPFPDRAAVVSTSTTVEDDGVREIPVDQAGMYYPVVYGYPGFVVRAYTGATDGLYEGLEAVVPCPMRVGYFGAATFLTDSQIVVSHDSRTFLPDTCRMRNNETGVEATLDVVAATDDLGRPIGVATFTDARVGAFDFDETPPAFTAGFSPDGGGIAAPREAYDVLVDALGRWGGDTVDWGRIPEIEDHIRGYLVDTWAIVDVPGGVWVWLVEALGVGAPDSTESAGLPIAIRLGLDGRYFVPLRYATDPRRTVRTLDTTRGEASRMGSLRVTGTPVNTLNVTFGYDMSVWAGEVRHIGAVLNATVDSLTSGVVVEPHGLATASIARYGARVETLEVPWTWDRATALRVAAYTLDRDALPWTTVRYRVPEEWGLREGDQIRLIDDEVAIDALAIVHGPPYVSSDGVTVTLRLPGLL